MNGSVDCNEMKILTKAYRGTVSSVQTDEVEFRFQWNFLSWPLYYYKTRNSMSNLGVLIYLEEFLILEIQLLHQHFGVV